MAQVGSNIRQQVARKHIAAGIQDIITKLDMRLNTKGDGQYASRHEIWGIIAEEYDEALDELRINTPEGYDNFAKELKDIAVAAMFGYICVKYGYIQPPKVKRGKGYK